MEDDKQQLGIRVLLFPWPSQGHIRPMLHLATALYSKGFSITIIHTHYNAPDPAECPNFTFHFIDDGLSNQSDSFKALSMVRSSCSEKFRDCLADILSDDSDLDAKNNKEPIACLITDPVWDFVGPILDSFNLPRIALNCGSMLTPLLYASLPLLREKGYFRLQESESEEPVVEFPPLKVKDLPIEAYHHALTSVIEVGRTYSQGLICNAFEELEPSAMAAMRQLYRPCPIFPVGPLHKYTKTSLTSESTHDQSCISWLNSQAPKSVLYVSFGSISMISKADFSEVAWGLANSMQPFLLVIRPDMIQGLDKDNEILPDGFSETVGRRGHIVKWAPQQEVLAHPAVGGFWTHCGWNSTIESVCQGVPMICQPFFTDQPVNARYISDVWRIGLLLEKGQQRDDIERAIRRLMVENEGEEMRERAAALMKAANLCLMEGGSMNNLVTHILSFQSKD